MNENNLLLNQAFCVELESESEKCHPDLGDGRKTYQDNNYMVFQHGGKFYFVPEADEFGGNRTLTRTKLKELELLFVDRLITIGELPEAEVV